MGIDLSDEVSKKKGKRRVRKPKMSARIKKNQMHKKK
jgi:hypothetical protein